LKESIQQYNPKISSVVASRQSVLDDTATEKHQSVIIINNNNKG
jgi:hypothetical protein